MKPITKEEYEIAKATVVEYEKKPFCSKCNAILGDRWEYSSNGFEIIFYVDCCSTDALWDTRFGKSGENLQFNHPAIISENSNAQKIELSGSKDGKYKLCPECNRELMKLVGDFIR